MYWNSYLDVQIFANKTNTPKTKNSNPIVNFLPILSIRKTVTNSPVERKRQNWFYLNVLVKNFNLIKKIVCMISLTWKFCKCCPGKIHIVWCSKTFTLNKAGLFNLHRGTCILKNSSFSITFHNAIHNFIPKSTNLLHVKIAYWKYKYKSTLFYSKTSLFHNFSLFAIKKWFMMTDFTKWFAARKTSKSKVLLNLKIFAQISIKDG